MSRLRLSLLITVVLSHAHLLAAITEDDCEACCATLVDDYENWQPDGSSSYGGTCTGACATGYREPCQAGCRGPTSVTDVLTCSLFQNQCDAGVQWINQGFTTKTFAQIPPNTERFCAPGGVISVTAVPTNSPVPPSPMPTDAPTVTAAPSLRPTKSPVAENDLAEILPIAIAGSAAGVVAIAVLGLYLQGGGAAWFGAGQKKGKGKGNEKAQAKAQAKAKAKEVEVSQHSYVTDHYVENETKDDDDSSFIPYLPPSVALSVFSEGQSTVYAPINEATYRVTYDFLAENPDELSVAKDSKVQGVRQVNSNWYLVRNEDGMQGMVPVTYLEEEVDDDSVIPYEVDKSVL